MRLQLPDTTSLGFDLGVQIPDCTVQELDVAGHLADLLSVLGVSSCELS